MKLSEWAILIGLIAAIVILWQFREILMLVFAAAVLAIALNRLARYVSRRLGISRRLAVPTVLALVVVGMSAFVGFVMPLFIGQFQQLLLLVPQGVQQLINWANQIVLQPPPWFPELNIELLPPFSELLQQGLSLFRQIFGNFLIFFSGSLAIVLQAVFVLVLTLMMTANPIPYRNLLILLFPSFYRRRADYIFSKCESSLINWLRGVFINSIFVSFASAIGLMILGVPFVFSHALIAGIFNFIPNIGPFLSVVFPVSVALLDSFGKAVAVIILYVVIQNVESYWFSPMVMQKQVSILPAMTLISQIFFTTILGPLGLVLALPLTVVAKTWIDEAWVKDVLDQWQGKKLASPEELAPAADRGVLMPSSERSTLDSPASDLASPTIPPSEPNPLSSNPWIDQPPAD
ncbi:AI-2E family transporter [Egbenema bharatensis]|uniref:AI-2E family transporter n=1 Tax=Egbenema bharatensis TaxID=3463334 RepID=UPI003A8B048F